MTFMLEACGGGIPVRLRVDQFSVDVDFGEAVDTVESSLLAQILPKGREVFTIWPEDLLEFNMMLISLRLRYRLT